jgi:hypothetical protein
VKRIAQIFARHFSVEKCRAKMLSKMFLATFLAIFSKRSSGHPEEEQKMRILETQRLDLADSNETN